MFWKTKDEIEELERDLRWHTNQLRDRYYELDRKLDMLIEYLGITESQPGKPKYIKKGGPERGEQETNSKG